MGNERERAIEALGWATTEAHAAEIVDTLTAHIAHVIGGAEGKTRKAMPCKHCDRIAYEQSDCAAYVCSEGHASLPETPAPAPSASSDERRWWVVANDDGKALAVFNEKASADAFGFRYRKLVEVVPAARAESAERERDIARGAHDATRDRLEAALARAVALGDEQSARVRELEAELLDSKRAIHCVHQRDPRVCRDCESKCRAYSYCRCTAETEPR